jgi:uncharacterized protein (TIGR00297 family)
MFNFLTLDKEGILAAILLGAALLLFGGTYYGLFFLGVLLWFLLLSSIVTWIGKKRKKAFGVYEKNRGWRNVVANGGVPLIIAAIYHYGAGFLVPNNLLIVSYVASVAAITADKFSSEIGVLGGRPTMLVTLKKVKQGTSGAVTWLGIFSGLLASALVGLVLIGDANFSTYMLMVVFSGFIGNAVDSILGYFENKGVGNKFTSNALCALSGWLVCLLVLFALNVH